MMLVGSYCLPGVSFTDVCIITIKLRALNNDYHIV